LVLCHNVLEYIDPNDRKDYLLEFKRILKDDGLISIIKHNHVGKVLQSVVFANDINQAFSLLNGENFESLSFASGSTYT
ncbi:class I SAM-dependent methyltransferase, partial [Streptococcus pneumoniae]